MEKTTTKKIYLVGYSEQGCGFSPFAAFLTKEDRDIYLADYKKRWPNVWWKMESEEMDITEYIDVI